MLPKRTPVKGEPDFTAISDERLKEFVDLAQQMIFAYEHCDEAKTCVLKEVWKQLSDEYTDRMGKVPFEPVESTTVHKIKMVKPLKRVKR